MLDFNIIRETGLTPQELDAQPGWLVRRWAIILQEEAAERERQEKEAARANRKRTV